MNVLIICRVVDHFGDAGVCLRLARGLAARPNRVDLLIDRPELILAMCPSLRLGERVDGIRLMDWSDSAVAELVGTFLHAEATDGLSVLEGAPHSVNAMVEQPFDAGPRALLIETFHHEAPEPLRALFETLPGAARVMLDYLATEPWADSMQGMSAVDRAYPRPQRHWWAPSFSKGLLLGDPAQLKRMLVGECSVERPASDVFWVLGFGYADAPWAAFENAVKIHGLPDGFSRMQIHTPSGIERSQDEFDALLCSTNLNFVRGEDSFVRAHWAAASSRCVPFVWQPYRQENCAHADKLGGWMDQVIVGDALEPLRRLHLAFNRLGVQTETEISNVWRDCVSAWPEIRQTLAERSRGLVQWDLLDSICRDLSL